MLVRSEGIQIGRRANRVTGLELFFDLVFVVVVIQLGSLFSLNVSVEER